MLKFPGIKLDDASLVLRKQADELLEPQLYVALGLEQAGPSATPAAVARAKQFIDKISREIADIERHIIITY